MAAIAVVAALGGCGSSSDSSKATTGASTATEAPSEATVNSSSPSKEEFTEKANEICNRGKKQALIAMTSYVKARQNSPKTKSELLLEAIHAAFLPQIQKQIDQIRALPAPEGEEEQVNAFLAAMQEGVDTVKSKSSTRSEAQLGHSFEHSAHLAREFGIDACAYG